MPDPSDRRRIALVTTTIRVPRFLADVLANGQRHGHADRVRVIVVGDRKTPSEAAGFLKELNRRHPAEVTFLDLDRQRQLLRRWPSLDLFIRFDSIQRRNVGFLQAALDGANVIISVDDDNHITADDFFGRHSVVGREVRVPVVRSESGWFNVATRLVADPPRRFYPRGYPKSRQDWTTTPTTITPATVRAVVNAGLWLDAPDVDATAHLEEPIHVAAMNDVEGEESCALAAGTWCPINTQNTAFDAALLPAMYLPVMHDWVRGYRISRMDDIWMGYFLRAIGDGLDDAMLFGPPLVTQKRNPHDGLADLAEELAGYRITERLVEYLRGFASRETTYHGAYRELIDHLRDTVEADAALEIPERECLRQMMLGMAAWHQTMADVLGIANH